ncbi:hypothetical protein Tco_0065121 [Tanacetum coccineum]
MVLKYKQRRDSDGWIWRIGKHKRSKDGGFGKSIDNPYARSVENRSSSFFIMNISNTLDAKALWMWCGMHGKEKGNKGSFASVIAGEGSFHNKASMGVLSKQTNTIGMKHLVLNENDLLKFDDSDEVVLAKVREVELMSKLYEVMENEGFDEVEILRVLNDISLTKCLRTSSELTWQRLLTPARYRPCRSDHENSVLVSPARHE